jgi:uncharacterized repeat protein (TIGR02543 family)
MRRAVGWGALALALAMVLGVGSANGRSLAAPSTVTVQVIGLGKVKSSPDQEINCGNGKTDCYAAFSAGTMITLNATDQGPWTFDHWEGDCAGSGATCTLVLDGTEHDYYAPVYFNGPATGTSTLAVNYTGFGTLRSGDPVGNINCGTVVTDATTDPITTLSTTDCSWNVLTGSTLGVRAIPDEGAPGGGYVFEGWANTCQRTDAECTIVMDENRSLSANFVPAPDTESLTVTVAGNGRVKGAGIDCQGPGTCVAQEPQDATVTMSADADSGYIFTGWSGTSCIGAGPTCTVTMDVARTVTATFTLAVPLSVQVSGNGNVSGGSGAINCGNGGVICSGSFALNATVTLIATPATGATFTGWTGACGGTATSCTVLMNQAKDVSASFLGGTAGGAGLLLSVSVSGSGVVSGPGISCGNGSTTCTTTPAVNATVTLTATPVGGATFAGWGGGSCTGTIPTCTVQMTAARSVTATFTGGGPGTTGVLLSVSVTGAGTVSGGGVTCGNGLATCSASVPTGSAITLSARPATGASFTGWGGACSGSATTCTVSMTSAKSVTAGFTALAAGTLSLTVKGKGAVSAPAGRCVGTGVSKTCVQRYAKGRSVSLAVTATAGNTFAGWGNACALAGRRLTCTVALDTAKSVTATFVPATTGGGQASVLTSLGRPIVTHVPTGYRVTLRFNTTRAGIARVVGLRAGRVGARVTLRVAAGPARIGPFPVRLPGFYTFQVRLGTALLQWPVCLGRCGASATAPPFLLVRLSPSVTRSGDVWSVTLHAASNQISVARVRAVRNGRPLVDQRSLARAGRISIGPFLLGPGSYALRLNATDAYGRTRSLTWVVALAG